jgi:hypothetical protein
MLKLNICISIAIKITELPFKTNPGMSSSPTALEGLKQLMASQTSASGIGVKDRDSEDCGRLWIQ